MKYLLWLMLIGFPLAGAIVIFAGVQGLWTTWRRRPSLRSAVGTIVGFEAEDAFEEVAYYPVLRFTTESGKVKQFCSHIAGSTKYRIGATLPVLYDPDGIMPPTIDSWFALWGSYLLFILSGPIFFIGSALVYVAFRNRLMGG